MSNMLQLRPFQKLALDALQEPGHLLCVAPTGSGKSLIYEKAALKPGRRTLLITPLTALGRQQHARLSKLGGLTSALGVGNPGQSPPSRQGTGIWIVSPEKLLIPSQLQALRDWKPNFLVVDECHCLWEWGEGFRPAFKKIPDLIHSEKIPSSLWLTATLPIEAREELRSLLRVPLRELGGFDLPPSLELNLARVRWADRADAMLGWIRQLGAPGIVFVNTRESARRLTRLIQSTGKNVMLYHAGLSAEERRSSEALIATSMPDVIVATSAFGMGMDYPQLEWALLWQAPSTLLSFAQAIGRVGRNSKKNARALALWDDDDFRLLEWTLQGSPRRRQQLELVRGYLNSKQCRREDLRAYFSTGTLAQSSVLTPCGKCDQCRMTHS